MKTEETVEKKIEDCNAVLAAATKACPALIAWDEVLEDKPADCPLCHGTGEVARFEAFRQACEDKWHTVWQNRMVVNALACPSCSGTESTGWRVRAGSLAGALVGLTPQQRFIVFHRMAVWSAGLENASASEAEIRLAELEAVIEQLENDD